MAGRNPGIHACHPERIEGPRLQRFAQTMRAGLSSCMKRLAFVRSLDFAQPDIAMLRLLQITNRYELADDLSES